MKKETGDLRVLARKNQTPRVQKGGNRRREQTQNLGCEDTQKKRFESKAIKLSREEGGRIQGTPEREHSIGPATGNGGRGRRVREEAEKKERTNVSPRIGKNN